MWGPENCNLILDMCDPSGPVAKTPCFGYTGGSGLIPSQGTKMPHATRCSQNRDVVFGFFKCPGYQHQSHLGTC